MSDFNQSNPTTPAGVTNTTAGSSTGSSGLDKTVEEFLKGELEKVQLVLKELAGFELNLKELFRRSRCALDRPFPNESAEETVESLFQQLKSIENLVFQTGLASLVKPEDPTNDTPHSHLTALPLSIGKRLGQARADFPIISKAVQSRYFGARAALENFVKVSPIPASDSTAQEKPHEPRHSPKTNHHFIVLTTVDTKPPTEVSPKPT